MSTTIIHTFLRDDGHAVCWCRSSSVGSARWRLSLLFWVTTAWTAFTAWWGWTLWVRGAVTTAHLIHYSCLSHEFYREKLNKKKLDTIFSFNVSFECNYLHCTQPPGYMSKRMNVSDGPAFTIPRPKTNLNEAKPTNKCPAPLRVPLIERATMATWSKVKGIT